LKSIIKVTLKLGKLRLNIKAPRSLGEAEQADIREVYIDNNQNNNNNTGTTEQKQPIDCDSKKTKKLFTLSDELSP